MSSGKSWIRGWKKGTDHDATIRRAVVCGPLAATRTVRGAGHALRYFNTPSTRARATAWVRLAAASLWQMALTCDLTVLSAT